MSVDIIELLRSEKTAKVVNYSYYDTFSEIDSLVPCSCQTGKVLDHVSSSKKDFEWLKRTVDTFIDRPIVFHHLVPA